MSRHPEKAFPDRPGSHTPRGALQPVLCDISTAARLGEGTAESAKDVLQDLGRGRKVEPDMALAGFAKVQPSLRATFACSRKCC